MKLQINRYYISIIPESEVDEAYLEEVLGLKEAHQEATAERINAMGLNCWAYLVIRRAKTGEAR